MSRADKTDSATIRFSSSLLSEKRTPKSRAKKKNLHSHRGKAFHKALDFLLLGAHSP